MHKSPAQICCAGLLLFVAFTYSGNTYTFHYLTYSYVATKHLFRKY